jgi:hypothetical protein
MQTKSHKRILIAPLDWGMGHATRCIPLIIKLQQQGAEVLIAVPQTLETRLRQSISNVQFIPLKGYEIRYHKGVPVWLSVLVQSFKIRKAIRDEHRWIMEHAETLKIDQIISDNRYGLWHPSICSILLTHQLQPIAPFGGGIARAFVRRFMRGLLKNFNEIHVPDYSGSKRLSGKLSTPFEGLPPVNYIGPLSRFTCAAQEEIVSNTLLAILSGPEPHYSRFYKGMKEKAQDEGFVFRALGWKLPEHADGNSAMLNPSDAQFAIEVARAEKIVCSAGYSTLCDLHALGREAELFPTPGQTEQEYLTKLHSLHN